jgi:hypothetical protein
MVKSTGCAELRTAGTTLISGEAGEVKCIEIFLLVLRRCARSEARS